MKKPKGPAVCYALSGLFCLGFIISTLLDYSRYTTTLNSAPFYIWIIVNAVYFLLPAMIAFIAGALLKKRGKSV